MNNLIKYGIIYALALMLSSCKTVPARIDNDYAISTAKHILSLHGNVSAQKLNGGFGDTTNFLVADGLKKYVVRFLKPGSGRKAEISDFRIASDQGYGPQVYFADYSRGIIIMEYLSGKKVSYQDLQSKQLYVSLAQLLRKIHQGPALNGRYDIFERVSGDMQDNKLKYGNYLPLVKIEEEIAIIHRALLPHLITTIPCHNDLHGGNLALLKNEFKAIDYGDAGQNDPYFDIATVAAVTDLYNKQTNEHEKILLTTYLGHQPATIQIAKLYLMKQLVLIKWMCDTLSRLKSTSESIYQYESIRIPSSAVFKKEQLDGRINLSKPRDNLKLLKLLIVIIINNFESKEFQDAVASASNKD